MINWQGLGQWARERGRERSTWLGLTGLLTAAGVALNPEQTAAIASAGVAIAGLVAALTKDPPAPDGLRRGEPTQPDDPGM